MSARIVAIYLLAHSVVCREGYYWMNYEPSSTWSIPTDAFAGGLDINQNNIYIGQMTVWGHSGVYPVTIAIGQKARAPFAGSQISTITPFSSTPPYDPNRDNQYNQQGNSGINNSGQVVRPHGGAGSASYVTNIFKAAMYSYLPKAAKYALISRQLTVNQEYEGQTTDEGSYPQNGNAVEHSESTTQSSMAPNQGPEDPVSFIQVLCSKTADNFKWVPTSSTTLYLVGGTTRVVRGGLDLDNHITYIGRIKYQGNVVIGKVTTRDIHNNANMIFVFNSREHKVQTYEVLTYSESNTTSA